MKFRTVFLAFASCALTLALSGCGPSIPGAKPAEPAAPPPAPKSLTLSEGLSIAPGDPVYAVAGLPGLLESLLPDGTREFPVVSTAVLRNYDDDTVSVPTDLQIRSISSDGSGGFRLKVLIVDGEGEEEITVHFPASSFTDEGGWERFSVDREGGRVTLSSHTDSFEAADKTRGSPEDAYFDVLRGEVEDYDDSDTNHRIIFSFGARTPADGLPRGTAAYHGWLSAYAWNAEDPDHDERHSYGGNLTLAVDFSNSSISGTVKKLRHRQWQGDRTDMSAANRIDISNGSVVNGQFTADWTGQGPEGGPATTVRGMEGQILGEFYGPEAEEVAGVLNGRRAASSSGDPAYVIYGRFDARNNDGTFELSDVGFSGLPPVYAKDDGKVLADRTDKFGFQSVQRTRDFRNVKDRIKSPMPTADVKSVAPDGSGGYRIVYVVGGKEQEIHFEGPIAPGNDGEDVTVDGNEYGIHVWSDGFNGQHFRTLYTGVNLCEQMDEHCSHSFYLNFGQETKPERLSALGSASYSGNIWATLAPPNGGHSSNWRNLLWRSEP